MSTINMNIAKRISNRKQWGVKRINCRDGSTTYKCTNCGIVICHDEPGSIRLGILPHIEDDEDSKENGTCRRRIKQNEKPTKPQSHKRAG